MVTETNTNQVRTWINDARPEDLLTIAPLLFGRIGTLDQPQQERFAEDVRRDPKAKRLFEQMQSYSR